MECSEQQPAGQDEGSHPRWAASFCCERMVLHPLLRLLLRRVAVEVDAGLAAAVLEAAGLAPEADALHAAGAGRRAGAAPQHLSACSLLVVVTAGSGGIRIRTRHESEKPAT